jgi:hypothetical protein
MRPCIIMKLRPTIHFFDNPSPDSGIRFECDGRARLLGILIDLQLTIPMLVLQVWFALGLQHHPALHSWQWLPTAAMLCALGILGTHGEGQAAPLPMKHFQRAWNSANLGFKGKTALVLHSLTLVLGLLNHYGPLLLLSYAGTAACYHELKNRYIDLFRQVELLVEQKSAEGEALETASAPG